MKSFLLNKSRTEIIINQALQGTKGEVSLPIYAYPAPALEVNLLPFGVLLLLELTETSILPRKCLISFQLGEINYLLLLLLLIG